MKFLIISAVLFFSNLVNSMECPFSIPSENLCLDIRWIDGPKYDVYSKAIFSFWKKDDLQKTPTALSQEIEIYPWMVMQNMQHGARPVELKKITKGVYEVSKIYFSPMPGQWEMRVQYVGIDRRSPPLLRVEIEFL